MPPAFTIFTGIGAHESLMSFVADSALIFLLSRVLVLLINFVDPVSLGQSALLSNVIGFLT